MKTRILMILCLALSLAAFGCEKKEADHGHDEAKAEEPAAEEKADDKKAEAEPKEEAKEEEAAKDLEKVEVAKAGTKFDPAVQAEQMPAGAWYCDMGDVHWAAMEKPESGKCPECNMALKQYDATELAAQKEKAVEAHGHEDGDHAHEDGDHAHGDHGHDDGEGHAHEGDDHGHAH